MNAIMGEASIVSQEHLTMDDQARAFYEPRFKAQFLESKAVAFQTFFADIMSRAHPADFVPCRPWGSVGDRKNDGYLKSERTLFQVYAPSDLKVNETIRKIKEDFTEAIPHWHEHFDTWVFVHNALGGLPPDVISTLLDLGVAHPTITVTQWGFEELRLRFDRLSTESLKSLYGAIPPSPPAKTLSETHRKMNRSQDLANDGKQSEAIREMTEALALARSESNEEDEVEILVALAIMSSSRHGQGDKEFYLGEAEKRVASLKSAAAKALYFRAKATACERKRDSAGAEDAYRRGLGLCDGDARNQAKDQKERNNIEHQLCILSSSFVHFLCNQKRLAE